VIIYAETHEKVACRVCGTTTAYSAMSQFGLCETDVFVRHPRKIGDAPICWECSRKWDNLARKVGRDISEEEFCLWMLAKLSKRRMPPSQLHGGDITVSELAGTIYDDFLVLL
jgi:hypothetical protein